MDKITIASFIVGCIGAAIAWYVSYPELQDEYWHGISFIPGYITTIVAPISGFLSCLFLSGIYLRHVEGNTWQKGILPALVVSTLAGSLSGLLTGLTHHPLIAIGGLYTGASLGFAFGLLSWLVFGKYTLRFLVQK